MVSTPSGMMTLVTVLLPRGVFLSSISYFLIDLSFTKYDLISTPEFVGVNNYVYLLTSDEEFMKKKRERNIIDFNDIEHYALKILVKKDENGNYDLKKQQDLYVRYLQLFILSFLAIFSLSNPNYSS